MKKSCIFLVFGYFLSIIIPSTFIGVNSPINNEYNARSIFATVVIWFCAMSAAGFMIGMPIFFFLRKIEFINFWSSIFSGAITGCIAISVMSEFKAAQETILLFSFIGGVSGIIFWLFYKLSIIIFNNK